MSSLFREGRRIWRRFLEGGDSRSVLRQRPSSDLLRPSRDQTGRPAEGVGVLHGVLQPLLKKSAANLQPAEKGEHLHTRRITNIWKWQVQATAFSKFFQICINKWHKKNADF